VQQGDSLYAISKKLYGRGDRYLRIFEANKATLGDDVNAVLKTGQVLTLPEPPTAK
jgi:nucleoid-associated protein YgaU